ncbi:MAG TPA: hypothetical protein VF021_11870 [Longimicrobiales bacterium]
MSLFAFIVMVWVLARVTGVVRRRRSWGACHTVLLPGHLSRQRGWRRPHTEPPPPQVTPPQETAFDVLKKRYVAGRISDDQYERELDALLRTPEGRAQLQ